MYEYLLLTILCVIQVLLLRKALNLREQAAARRR